MRFVDFAQQTTVTDTGVEFVHEGIEHIESLPLDKFIDAVENLAQFIASEKLDGSNLIFGFDSKGKFYTSRESKSGKKVYSYTDYEDGAASNGFRSAHAALQQIVPELKSVLGNGDAVETEIMFGRQPNAIVYGSSHIAFLRMIPGENKKHPDQSKIKKLEDVVKDKTIAVKVPHVFTDDGIEIKTTAVPHKWKFTSVSYVNSHHFTKVNVEKEINSFKKFLEKKNPTGNLNLTNMDIIGVKLPSVPSNVREEIKNEREKLTKTARDKFMLPIKEKFLSEILRKLAPSLRDVAVEPHEDLGVEGIVLLNPKTLQQLKIVDKDVFTVINQFNFAIRNEIKRAVGGKHEFEGVSLGTNGDIFGNMLKRIAQVLDIPGLGEYTGIKRTIKKFVGDNLGETMKNFTSQIKEKDVDILKKRLVEAIRQGKKDLADGLAKYNAEWKTYKLTLKTGKEIKYTDEVHSRTLMVFAEVRKELNELLEDVSKSNNLGDILVSLYGKQLKSIH